MGFMDKLMGGGKKQEAFYASYADTHNLVRSTDEIPAVTKSLEGDAVTKERFDGRLAAGFKGTVALVETTIRTSATVVNSEQYNELHSTHDGSSRVETSAKAYPSTVVMISLEDGTGSLGGLAVKKNYNKQSMGKNDVYGNLRRVTLEGLDLDNRFYVFADEGADPETVRGIFSPSFSAWLNAQPEKFFSFEVGQDTLVTKQPKFPKDEEEMDARVTQACEIARQLKPA